eukprot:TRINITY_DN1158_c0_g3_i2.p1 TRINITY_DN1158_c0_g3~~TRINITY_DN1158_c0_g3_i2.p1  ORF type:complete len:299 (-),score=59.92 TRINITY_DN1158_c0_g3_i2:502-1398(-)
MTDFTRDETTAIRAVTFTACSLSILGCLFVMFSYLRFPTLRSFPLKLVFIQSITDLFGSLSTMMSVFASGDSFDTSNASEHFACVLQGAGIQFFYLSAFIWTLFIALTAYVMITKPLIPVENYERYFHMVAWGIPGLFLIILLSLNSFGEAGVWCWIEDPESPLRFAFFYGPMIAILSINLLLYTICRNELHKYEELFSTRQKASSVPFDRIKGKITKRLLAVVLSWICCWIWAVINRLQNIIDPDHPQFWLYLIHSIFSPTFGFFNSLIYGNNKKLRQHYRELIFGERAQEHHLSMQ